MSACSSTASAPSARDPLGGALGAGGGAAVVHADDAGALLRGAYGDLGAEAGAGAGDTTERPSKRRGMGSGCAVARRMSFGRLGARAASDEHAAAVDVEDLAGDERGAVGGEEGDRVGDLLGRPEPPAGTSDSRLSRLPSLSR